MGYVPDDAKWFLAQLIIEISVEDDPHNVIHRNTVLVEAGTPEVAYTRALELGQAMENSYENIDDKLVTLTFRGLRKLDVIYDKLEHGAEIFYSEDIGVSEEQIQMMLSRKENLSVFEPYVFPDRSETPNYGAKSVAEMLAEHFDNSEN